jgi:hypothetical protein
LTLFTANGSKELIRIIILASIVFYVPTKQPVPFFDKPVEILTFK